MASGPELSALRPYKVSYCIQQASWAMSTCTMVVVVVPDFLLIVLYTLIYNIYTLILISFLVLFSCGRCKLTPRPSCLVGKLQALTQLF